jgi:hypothetical protein
MRKRVIQGLVLASMALSLPLFPGVSLAQEAKGLAESDKTSAAKEARPVFRVEYVVREMEDGKRTNARSYMLLVRNDRMSKLRVGSRVPYTVQEKQFQYADIGMNIDCRVVEGDSSLLLNTFLESSSLIAHETLTNQTSNPVFRQMRFEEDSEVSPGKPTLIGTLDDVGSNRRYEVEVTVTKVR